jgi:hypothetical protein
LRAESGVGKLSRSRIGGAVQVVTTFVRSKYGDDRRCEDVIATTEAFTAVLEQTVALDVDERGIEPVNDAGTPSGDRLVEPSARVDVPSEVELRGALQVRHDDHNVLDALPRSTFCIQLKVCEIDEAALLDDLDGRGQLASHLVVKSFE